ncbi:DMT family transporter [Bradyrhizobium brasilense]|uniref:EamA domain-containing membrane protein RarD n=1 Tax=Bradyrhizobium brasilense TaxID=1419277 RepID=A0A1G7LCW2_9BRAD|nr:DMT family transporter [Bradyrhizobium brasilense]MCC8974223.1 DMT family transporter [Bradyrhizobium brasilense]SDF46799.1 EamA domain-containing membrane protein RarD [Bradyrhizobium brasilense]
MNERPAIAKAAALPDTKAILLGVACGLGAALCWALGFVATRHGLRVGFTPVDLLMHRFLWSGIVFLPLVVRAGLRDLCGIGWGRGMALMLLGGPVMSLISYAGFMFVPLGHGSVIQPSCATLGGLFLAVVLLKEAVSLSRAAGAVVIVVGLAVIGSESIGHMGPSAVIGDLIFVATGLMFAGFATLVRYWRVSAFSVASVISVLSLSLFPLYAASGGLARDASIGLPENALQAIAQGILAGPAAMYLFAVSIQRLGVARAAVFPATVPVLTLLLGWLLIGEPPTTLQAAGLAAVLAGFYLAQRQR